VSGVGQLLDAATHLFAVLLKLVIGGLSHLTVQRLAALVLIRSVVDDLDLGGALTFDFELDLGALGIRRSVDFVGEFEFRHRCSLRSGDATWVFNHSFHLIVVNQTEFTPMDLERVPE
jgi:hypothetical protein